jgi:hypothetical protein
MSYEDFRTAIYKFYPGSDNECRWSVADMETLVFEQLCTGVFDLNDLGSYYRSFFTITHYLRSKNRISDAEQSRAFLHGFQSSVLAQIERRLKLKFPDHYPDDPYPLTDVHDAAKFVLAGTNTSSIGISHSISHSASVSNTSKSSDTAYIKSEQLSTIFKQFASTIISAISTSDTALHHDIQSNKTPKFPLSHHSCTT